MIKAEGAIPREYPSPEGGNNTIGIGHKIKDSEIKSGRFKAGGEYPQPLSIEQMIYAELSGDFPLGNSRQPTYKSLRPFDLVS